MLREHGQRNGHQRNGVYHGNLQVTGPRVSGIRDPDGGVARGVRGLFRQAHSA